MPQFTTEDVCYLKHGERQIMARVFKPEGAGPFPAYVDLHGGAWNNGDLNDRTSLGEYLAQRGYVMVTLNFRHAADGYPTSLADINYGIRWTKAHAKELKVNPDQGAKVIVDNLGRDLGAVYLPWWWWPITAIIRLLPWPIFKRLNI